jgi:hypothetical protein
MDRVKRSVESDRLRSALLTSISHDLKTPLASVLGAASALRDLADALNDTERRDLLATVIDESERLNRFIANLLDMTKLESGAIRPNNAPYDVGEIVGRALRRASKILAGHKVSLNLDAKLPMLDLDAVLFEQALFNLLDNAANMRPWAPRSRSSPDRKGFQPPATNRTCLQRPGLRLQRWRRLQGPRVHGLSQARRASDQRHESETADQPRQLCDVGVEAFGVDQRGSQDRPANVTLLASCNDPLLGLCQLVDHLSLLGNLGVPVLCARW